MCLLALMEGYLSHMFGPHVVLLLLLMYLYLDMECERSAGAMAEEHPRICKELICYVFAHVQLHQTSMSRRLSR